MEKPFPTIDKRKSESGSVVTRDIFDLKPRFLQTFNNAKSFQFIIAEITDVSIKEA